MSKTQNPESKVQSSKSELVIQFVGRRKRINPETGQEELMPRTAPTRRIDGKRIIDLPSDTIQKKGFTHEDAQFLLKAYPKEFKRKVTKGEK